MPGFDEGTGGGTASVHAVRDVIGAVTDNAAITDYYLIVNAAVGNVTINLPDVGSYPSGEAGVLVIKRVDASVNSVTLDGFSTQQIEQINSAPTFATTLSVPAATAVALLADATNSRWVISS